MLSVWGYRAVGGGVIVFRIVLSVWGYRAVGGGVIVFRIVFKT
jgi:hypothetical protein